jgi:hypothetical protein
MNSLKKALTWTSVLALLPAAVVLPEFSLTPSWAIIAKQCEESLLIVWPIAIFLAFMFGRMSNEDAVAILNPLPPLSEDEQDFQGIHDIINSIHHDLTGHKDLVLNRGDSAVEVCASVGLRVTTVGDKEVRVDEKILSKFSSLVEVRRGQELH